MGKRRDKESGRKITTIFNSNILARDGRRERGREGVHLMSSFLFSIASFSFTERYKERGDGRDERARRGSEEENGSKKKVEREREREAKENNVRGKANNETRREELTSPLCLSFALPLSLKEEGEKTRKEKKDQSKEGERERRENEEFTSSTCTPAFWSWLSSRQTAEWIGMEEEREERN